VVGSGKARATLRRAVPSSCTCFKSCTDCRPNTRDALASFISACVRNIRLQEPAWDNMLGIRWHISYTHRHGYRNSEPHRRLVTFTQHTYIMLVPQERRRSAAFNLDGLLPNALYLKLFPFRKHSLEIGMLGTPLRAYRTLSPLILHDVEQQTVLAKSLSIF